MRRRLAALLLVAAVLGGISAALAAPAGHRRQPASSPPPPPTESRPPYPVGLAVVRYVEPGRTVTYANGVTAPRELLTYIRYPAHLEGIDAPRLPGPFPLVIFGHGFEHDPSFYARLLDGLTAAGFVVAAPVFPLENPQAPGGPLRSDLPNEPADVNFLAARLLEANKQPGSPFAGLIAGGGIAVAGQSDGGDVALVVGYSTTERNPLVKAVVVYSGAELPEYFNYSFTPGSPPLLATQGTADRINLPAETEAFFKAAAPPKYLLWLEGAGHLEPYSSLEPDLSIVVRTTVCFLRLYLDHHGCTAARLLAGAEVAGVSRVEGRP